MLHPNTLTDCSQLDSPTVEQSSLKTNHMRAVPVIGYINTCCELRLPGMAGTSWTNLEEKGAHGHEILNHLQAQAHGATLQHISQ